MQCVAANFGAPCRQQIETTANALGFDRPRLAHEMQRPSIQPRIDQNLKLAHSLGIQGTPALVIGTDLILGVVDPPELTKPSRKPAAGIDLLPVRAKHIH